MIELIGTLCVSLVMILMAVAFALGVAAFVHLNLPADPMLSVAIGALLAAAFLVFAGHVFHESASRDQE